MAAIHGDTVQHAYLDRRNHGISSNQYSVPGHTKDAKHVYAACSLEFSRDLAGKSLAPVVDLHHWE